MKILKKRLRATALKAFAFLLINEYMVYAGMFYNPFDHIEINQRMAQHTIQLISPLVFSVDFNGTDPNDPFAFPKRQGIIVSQWHPTEEQIQYKGWIEYATTGGNVSSRDIVKLTNNSVYAQIFYMDAQSTVPYPDDDSYHHYFFALQEPITLYQLRKLLALFINSEPFQHRTAGINWIPVKSSEDSSDITIGLRGSLSFTYGFRGDFDLLPLFVQGKTAEMIYYFKDGIRFLSEHKRDTDYFLTSDLFPESAAEINYGERYQYLDRHGCFALGVVILANNDLINQYLPSEFKLIKVL